MNEPGETAQASSGSVPATGGPAGQLDFSLPAKPIADFVTRPDFPECVLGEHLDIGGNTGIVVAIAKQSIKVRSPEGATRSFNSYNLRRIYGPRVEPPPEPEPGSRPAPSRSTDFPEPSSGASEPEPPQAPPRPEMIEDPDFDQPVVPIAELVADPGFPKSAVGRHVDVGGYAGVVVGMVNESLRVRSRQGTSRNYNSARLRAIYGPGK